MFSTSFPCGCGGSLRSVEVWNQGQPRADVRVCNSVGSRVMRIQDEEPNGCLVEAFSFGRFRSKNCPKRHRRGRNPKTSDGVRISANSEWEAGTPNFHIILLCEVGDCIKMNGWKIYWIDGWTDWMDGWMNG